MHGAEYQTLFQLNNALIIPPPRTPPRVYTCVAVVASVNLWGDLIGYVCVIGSDSTSNIFSNRTFWMDLAPLTCFSLFKSFSLHAWFSYSLLSCAYLLTVLQNLALERPRGRYSHTSLDISHVRTLGLWSSRRLLGKWVSCGRFWHMSMLWSFIVALWFFRANSIFILFSNLLSPLVHLHGWTVHFCLVLFPLHLDLERRHPNWCSPLWTTLAACSWSYLVLAILGGAFFHYPWILWLSNHTLCKNTPRLPRQLSSSTSPRRSGTHFLSVRLIPPLPASL